jgi:hypothetical protein
VPGQRLGRVHQSVGISAVGPGPAAGLEGHHERQAGLREFAAEPVLVAVRAVGGHRAEHEARSPGCDREIRADRQFGAERRVALPCKVPGRGVRHGMHRIAQTLIGPQRGDRDHPVVGLAVPAQPLVVHVRGLRAVLTVHRIIDHQHPAAVRRGRRIFHSNSNLRALTRSRSQRDSERKNCSRCTRRMLRSGHRLRPGQRRQRLVPVPRGQQPGQVLPEPRPSAKEPNRSSNRAAYPSSGPGAAGHGRRRAITPQSVSHYHSRAYRTPGPESTNYR